MDFYKLLESFLQNYLQKPGPPIAKLCIHCEKNCYLLLRRFEVAPILQVRVLLFLGLRKRKYGNTERSIP